MFMFPPSDRVPGAAEGGRLLGVGDGADAAQSAAGPADRPGRTLRGTGRRCQQKLVSDTLLTVRILRGQH